MDELTRLLDEEDPVRRRRALMGLTGPPPGDDAAFARFLYRALGDEDFGVRQEAARLCQRSRALPVVLEVLERALCDDDSLARRSAAMEAFGHVGEAAVDSLARLVGDRRAGVRRLAVDALGLTQAPRAFAALSRAAEDESPAVRSAALEALSRTGAPEVPERIFDVITRAGEAASVALAGLLALEGLGAEVPAARLKPFLLDSLTAPSALRLIGRAGEVDLLAELLASATGARQRAALSGIVEALSRHASSARETLESKRADLEPVLAELLSARDSGVAGHALFVGAHLGRLDWFLTAVLREDSAELSSALHRALAAVTPLSEDTAKGLEALSERAGDGRATEILRELAQAVRERLPAEGASAPPPPAPPRVVRAPPAGAETGLFPRDFEALSALFRRRAGLLFEPHMTYRIEARLLPRLRATGAASWGEYVELLSTGSSEGESELQTALERVTVHETYFFRERPQLDAFAGELLPVMLDHEPGLGGNPLVMSSGVFRVWSAGCSTGEEAWTLAMLLGESGYFGKPGLRYEVLGSDLSTSVIAAARKGRYGPRGFRGEIPPGVRDRYFEQDGANWAVTPALRERVEFFVANLVEPRDLLPLGRFHVIFCRNVLIYMSREGRARILSNLYDRLKPGGVLFLGHSESLLHVDTQFRFLPLKNELVYIKPGDRPFRPVPRAPSSRGDRSKT